MDIDKEAIEVVEQTMPVSHDVLVAAVEWYEARRDAIEECNRTGSFKEGMIDRLAKAEADLSLAVRAYEEWKKNPPKLRFKK